MLTYNELKQVAGIERDERELLILAHHWIQWKREIEPRAELVTHGEVGIEWCIDDYHQHVPWADVKRDLGDIA